MSHYWLKTGKLNNIYFISKIRTVGENNIGEHKMQNNFWMHCNIVAKVNKKISPSPPTARKGDNNRRVITVEIALKQTKKIESDNFRSNIEKSNNVIAY